MLTRETFHNNNVRGVLKEGRHSLNSVCVNFLQYTHMHAKAVSF